MIIEFRWTVWGGLEWWSIEPEIVERGVIITPKPKINRIPHTLKRVLPRKKESKGQRNTISLLKKLETQKKKRAHR